MPRKSGIGKSGVDQKYFQHNYVEVVRGSVPSLYEDTDFSIFGSEEDLLYHVLGKVLKTANDITSLIDVSSYDASDTRAHFILRNNKTNIRPYLFEKKILKALGASFSDYENEDDFKSFVSGTLIPAINLNSPSDSFVSGVSALDSSVNTPLKAHEYLIDTLSWLYFLNTSGPAGGYDPSDGVTDFIVSSLYRGKTYTETDGVSNLFEYLWKNRDVSSAFVDYLPVNLRDSDSSISSGLYTSGTQHLDRLKTLVGVWYNQSDDNSSELDDTLDAFLTLGESSFPTKLTAAGPFSKFLKALSFGFYDMNTIVDELGDLVSIERCPPEFLQYLASLIGWKLLTGDVDRWRAQIRHAIHLYKAKGTKRSLEDAITLLFPESGFNPASGIEETWESFIPRQIYYLIATESNVLRDPNYNQASADYIGIDNFDAEDKDTNYRFATDYILDKLQSATSAITINGTVFSSTTWDPENPDFLFSHRGKLVKVPPWENERFYETTRVTKEQASVLSSLLYASRDEGGLEVPAAAASSLSDSIIEAAYDGTFMSGQNRKWKYYTSGLSTPSNFSDIISRGDPNAMSLLDYWNSKGSTVISKVHVSSLEYFFDGISYPVDNIMSSMLDVFRQFAPLHVIVRLYLDSDFEDVYQATEDDGTCIGIVLGEDDDFDQAIILNYITSGTVASGNISDGFSSVTYSNSPRTSGRRRNLHYNLPAPAYTRNGLSMPISYTFGAHSGIPSSIPGMNSSEFIPLGYNFSSNQFFSTKGAASAIYDSSNGLAMSGLTVHNPDSGDPWRGGDRNNRSGYEDIDANFYGVDVSTTFPCRALYKYGCEAAITRSDSHPVRQAIIHKTLRTAETEDTAISLGENIYRNFAFSSKFYRSYYDYIRTFGSSLSLHEVFTSTKNVPNRTLNDGGPSFLDHAFGPLVWNSSFLAFDRLSSKDSNLSELEALRGTGDTIADHHQWSHVAAAPFSEGKIYVAKNNTSITLGSASMQTDSRETYLDSLTHWGYGLGIEDYVSLDSFSENISIVGRSTGSVDHFVVFNTPDSSGTSFNGLDTTNDPLNNFSTKNGSMSLYNRNLIEHGRDNMFIRWSLSRGKSYLRNPLFSFGLSDPDNQDPNASSVAEWQLNDHTSNSDFVGFGASAGSVTVSSTGSDPDRRNRFISATVSGEGTYGDSDSVSITQTNITGLKPEKEYSLNYSLKSDNTTCSGVRFIVKNTTKGVFALSGGTWGTTASEAYFASAGYNFFSSGSINFTPSSSFQSGDVYVVGVYPHGPYSGGWTTTTNTVSIESLSLTTSGTRMDNFLTPDHDYSITIRAKEGMEDTVTSPPEMSIGVRVITDPMPYAKETDYGDGRKFIFDFNSQKWEEFQGAKNTYGWYNLPLSSFELEGNGNWKTKTISFNTKNHKSPYTVKDPLFRRLGSKLHNIDTPYHIEVCKLYASEGFIIIDEVSVIDDSYKYQMSEFTLDEAKTIFTHLDEVNSGKSSRDASDSSGYYLTSGGGRDYYLEASSLNLSGTGTTSTLHSASGVIFEVSDD